MTKKIKGLIIALLVIASVYTAITNIERVNADELRTKLDEADNIAETILKEKKVEETKKETPIKEEDKDFFAWNIKEGRKPGAIIGKIFSDDVKLNTALAFTGESEIVLAKSAGIHTALSSTKHLTILAHSCEGYKGLEDKMFNNLKKLNVGEHITVDTVYGTYTLVVKETDYLTIDEYEENNYSTLLRGDVSFATCQKQGSEKGRRVVICDIENYVAK